MEEVLKSILLRSTKEVLKKYTFLVLLAEMISSDLRSILVIVEINVNPLRKKKGGGVGHVEMTVNEHGSLPLTFLLY